MTTNTTVAAHSAVTEIPPAPGARSYQYKHGDRPLDGYTIQRGAGRGGFGEVYYALSDSGREVALKLVLTYEQIELRGISQCMNLKSPHLVTIFDVKYGQDGRPWVIMEYVAGPSLRQLLDAAPSGLGTQKAAFFLREIGKGLTYLHDCGIVHRDLKPGNIFYENGYVKIGDYGLSKIISTSQHSGQTITVGTVHYMAPEIGAGNYDRGIDIYALGTLLFEMLTGQVPFFGSSTAEVLMKHLSSEVDLSAIEEPFKTVIRKAMAKNPAERYQNVQEMVEAIFGSEHVRNSVSHFSPESLTMVAGHVAQKIAPSGGSFTPSDAPADPAWQCDRWGRLAAGMDRVGEKFSRKQARWAQRLARKQARWAGRGWIGSPQPLPVDSFGSAHDDPLKLWHRVVLGVIVSGLTAIAAGVYGAAVLDAPEIGMLALLTTAAATAGAVIAWRLVGPALRHESGLLVRLGIGGAAALLSSPFLLAMAFADPFARIHRSMGGTVLAIFVTFLLLNWPHRLSAARAERVALGNLVRAALLGLVLSSMFDGLQPLAMLILAGISLASEVVAGFSPRGSVQPPVAPAFPSPPAPPQSPIPAPAQPAPAVPFPPAPPPAAFGRPVPRGARTIWLAFFVGFATLGLCLLLAMGTVHTDRFDRAAMFGFGAGAILFAIFSLRRSRRTTFIGYWEYLFRPVLQLLCLHSIVLATSFLTVGRLHGDDAMPAIFFVIFPSLVLFALTFFTGRGGSMTQTPVAPSTVRLPPSTENISFSGIVFGFSRFVLNVVGSLVLVFSLLVALAVVTDLPGLFDSGVLDPQMPRDLTRAFGTSDWPHLMRQGGAMVSFMAALVATGILMLPRRRFGPGYMLRGILGIGVLFLAVAALGRALPDWRDVSGGENFGSALSMYLQSVHGPGVVWAAVLLIAGQFLLLWPARRSRERALPAYPLPPSAQGELHPEKQAG